MLTYYRVCCAFESACALPSGVIRGFENTSNNLPQLLRFFIYLFFRFSERALDERVEVPDLVFGEPCT
jgi:hypothetical protein